MNPERWRQIEQLYQSVLERDPTQRASFLAASCQDDADLRQEVASLLAQTQATEAPVDQTAILAGVLSANHNLLKPGDALGPYQILGLLGTGGMGEVYSATDSRLGRKVAIKISQERFSGRFEREARAISALNHPNICTLYDVGPNYLVTEFSRRKISPDCAEASVQECRRAGIHWPKRFSKLWRPTRLRKALRPRAQKLRNF